MKKIILFPAIACLFFTSCEDKSQKTDVIVSDTTAKKEKNKKDLIALYSDTIPLRKVLEMQKHYKEVVKNNLDSNLIQLITMNSINMAYLAGLGKRVMFIMGANSENKLTVIVQVTDHDSAKVYLDISEFFTAGDPNMKGRDVLCPLPTNCDIAAKE